MAKQREEVQIVKGNNELPEYLRNRTAKGLENVREYILKQRVKIIQKQADSKLLDQFPMGTVLLSPSLAMIAPMKLDENNRPTKVSATFSFTPLFFFPSWGQMNDITLKGKEPMFLNYTVDPQSPIVTKSRARELREEPHPKYPNTKIRNIEMLNFVALIHDDKFAETPVIFTFARGEWSTGSNFLSNIRNTKADIFARKWDARTSMRSRNNNEWFGFDIAAPTEGSPWVTEAQLHQFDEMHELLKKEHAESGIKPEDLDDAVTDSVEAPKSDY